jgi:hypothetical protein
MGLLNFFSKTPPAVERLPVGSFTVDSHGNVKTATVASDFPRDRLADIANEVLLLLRAARAASLPLAEIGIHFAEFRITAREIHGGAIIFLSPRNASAPKPRHAPQP